MAAEDCGCKPWFWLLSSNIIQKPEQLNQITKQALKFMLVFLEKVRMSQSDYSMATRCSTWPLLACAALVENGEALLWAIVFFHIPIKRQWSRHSESCFFHYYSVCVCLVSWCTMVTNQVTKESWGTWYRGGQGWKPENTSCALSTSSYHAVIWLGTWIFLTIPAQI